MVVFPPNVMAAHQDRGVETPAFRPGRKRRVTSPEMSAVSDSVFACLGTGCSPSPPSRRSSRDHCGHARYVWNLAVEQHSHWHPGRGNAPGYLEQCRQLTQARAENPWLAAGSQTVQQQALRDFGRAMKAFFEPGEARPGGRRGARPGGMRDSGSSGGAAGSGTCAACPVRSARSGCPKPGGCGSAGPAPCRRAPSPSGRRTARAAGTSPLP